MLAGMNLANAFADSVRKTPDKKALYWGGQEFSYACLYDQAQVLARQLRSELGVKRGDRVGLWLKNCPEFIPGLFAIFQAEAVAVPINNFLKPDEVKFILVDPKRLCLLTWWPGEQFGVQQPERLLLWTGQRWW